MNAKRIQRELQQPFGQNDLEWRVQQAGEFNGKVWARIIAYVTNRAIQSRFDDVVGVFGWKNEYSPLPNSVGDGSLCGISLKFDGEWITKYDGSDNTSIEATKGGLSGSMKRAAVHFGVGRYLYDVEALYADIITVDAFKRLQKHEKEPYEKAKTKSGKEFYWKAPELDDKFLPKKHLIKSVYDTIIKLIKETKSDKEWACEKFGVDDLKDLYTDEAGALTTMLLKKKQLMEAEDEANKKD